MHVKVSVSKCFCDQHALTYLTYPIYATSCFGYFTRQIICICAFVCAFHWFEVGRTRLEKGEVMYLV